MATKKRKTNRPKSSNLTTCSGSGRALKTSKSAAVRKAASRNLNKKCKAAKKKK